MAKSRKRPAEAWVFVLEADTQLPLDQQTRFTLRPMTHAERAAVRDDLAREERQRDGTTATVARTRQQAYAIALAHIVSVENFPVGAPQAWPNDRAAQERYLEQLEDDDVLEIGNEVWARSTLGPPDEGVVKNFSPPELTSISGGSAAIETSTTVGRARETPS
jgi:hypothetical protein